MKLFSLLLCLPLCIACGQTAPSADGVDEAQDAAAHSDAPQARPNAKFVDEDDSAPISNTFAGRVQGFGLDVAETVFVEGVAEMGAALPVLVVVQSSTSGTCEHLKNGTYPKEGTLFPIALIQMNGEAVAQGRVYMPSNPDDETTDEYQVYAQLRHFNDTCAIEPDAADGMAILGRTVLNHYSPKQRAAGRFAFEMGQDRAAVSGSFDAVYCDAPKLLAEAQQLMNPTIDRAHCL